MKKHLAIILSLLLVLMGMSACADNTGQNNHNNSNNNGGGTTPPAVTAKNVLIAYFSCTGTTAGIAERIAEETGGTLHEIQPAVPYTEEDLDYYSGGRADQEQADPAARPAIANSVENMQDYDIVFLGYPIWHGRRRKSSTPFWKAMTFRAKQSFLSALRAPAASVRATTICTRSPQMPTGRKERDSLRGQRRKK